MLQSFVEDLSRVYEALFLDAKYAYPDLEACLDFDQARLARFVEKHGLKAYALDLPNLGKHLDRCLASSQYDPPNLPLSKRKKKGVLPLFLGSLYALVFDDDGKLQEDHYDPQAIFFLRQLLYAGKNAKVQCDDSKILAAFAEFREVDEQVERPESFWNSPTPDVSQHLAAGQHTERFTDDPQFQAMLSMSENEAESFELERIAYARSLLRTLDDVSALLTSTLGRYNPWEWKCSHGPGSVSNLDKEQNKYQFDAWPARLDAAFPACDFAYHNLASWASDMDTESLDTHLQYDVQRRSKHWVLEVSNLKEMLDRRFDPTEEPSSKMIHVLKNYKTPRLIASEPSMFMWCQQNLWHYFRHRIERSWISDFITFGSGGQERNRALALAGSETGDLATIDLSMASDLISCKVVQCLFSGNRSLLNALAATRSRLCELPVDPTSDGRNFELVVLNKYSTMGNATTFPVESLVFLAVALAACLHKHGLQVTPRSCKTFLTGKLAVFGDDIIIPKECRETCVDLLEALGFRVNRAKSFWTGKFRESCGIDAFDGHNVTPAYWLRPYSRRKPESYASTLETAQNFYKRFLVHSSNVIASAAQRDRKVPLLPYGTGFLGRQSFAVPSFRRLRSRWNVDLQRTEYFVPQLIAVAKKTPIEDHTGFLQYFTEDPAPETNWTSGVPCVPVVRVSHRWVTAIDLTGSARS